VTDISKEITDLKSAINMGYTRGRQKTIERTFKALEKAIVNTQPKRPWWKLWKFWTRNRMEV